MALWPMLQQGYLVFATPISYPFSLCFLYFLASKNAAIAKGNKRYSIYYYNINDLRTSRKRIRKPPGSLE